MFSRFSLYHLFIIQKDLSSKYPRCFISVKDKIVIHITFKQVFFNVKVHLLPAFFLLELITGQKPKINFSKKDCSFLKLRKNSLVSLSVTLRKQYIFVFLEKLIYFSFSKEKPFLYFNSSFQDRFGNENFSVQSSLIFPDVEKEFTLFMNLFKKNSPYSLSISLVHNSRGISKKNNSLVDYQFPYFLLIYNMLVYFFGVQLNNTHNIITNLCKIPGVGRIKSLHICRQVGILAETPWYFLTNSQISALSFWLESSFSTSYLIGPDLLQFEKTAKKFYISIKSTKGFRLSQGLPVNGQRTHTNGKTAKRLNKIIR